MKILGHQSGSVSTFNHKEISEDHSPLFKKMSHEPYIEDKANPANTLVHVMPKEKQIIEINI